MLLRFFEEGKRKPFAEVEVTTEEWVKLKRGARKAKMKVADFVLSVIESYCEELIRERVATANAPKEFEVTLLAYPVPAGIKDAFSHLP